MSTNTNTNTNTDTVPHSAIGGGEGHLEYTLEYWACVCGLRRKPGIHRCDCGRDLIEFLGFARLCEGCNKMTRTRSMTGSRWCKACIPNDEVRFSLMKIDGSIVHFYGDAVFPHGVYTFREQRIHILPDVENFVRETDLAVVEFIADDGRVWFAPGSKVVWVDHMRRFFDLTTGPLVES